MQFDIVDQWDDLLEIFPDEKKDIYFSEKYTQLYAHGESTALCAICIDNKNVMLMPYIRSNICDYYDFETAYGYGGPITNTEESEWCRAAFSGMHDYLSENNYICGFTRFHPLIHNEQLFNTIASEHIYDGSIRLLFDRNTVAIITSQSPDEIWTTQISSKNRNMIRKAEKNDLEYKAEYDFDSMKEFVDLYNSTMARLNAEEFYFFDDNYFERFKASFVGNAFLGTVRKDGKLICAALFMYSNLYGHYHLEGSDKDYTSLGANNYLLWKTACEMHELGIKEFHLGGGVSASHDDKLFKFKRVFSDTTKKFYIGKQIFNADKYYSICKEWTISNQDKIERYGNRLLKYRY